MPGQQRCFKCGSILEGEVTILDVNPPRMAAWKRPWRHLARSLKRQNLPQEKPINPNRDPFIDDFNQAISGLALSVVPGLGHAKMGGFRRVSPVVLSWVVDMIIALLLFPSTWGWIALFTSAALHAWLALDAGTLRQIEEPNNRFIAVLVGFGLCAAVYCTLVLNIPPGVSYLRTPLAIPGENITRGDILRFRDIDPNTPLQRGDIIRFHAQAMGRDMDTDRAVGQIIGLPGDLVTIQERCYYVNGSPLPPEAFPTPGWIGRNMTKPLQVLDHQYCITSEYGRGGQGLTKRAIRMALLVDHNNVSARATMLWSPLMRRHRLVSDPNRTENSEP